jgi:hypothetical protein
MKSINEYQLQELQWIHPKVFSGDYELRGGDEVFARLHLKGAFGSQITAETADGNCIIKRKRMGQTIIVLASDSPIELATIKRGMSGEATLITFEDREYRWRCTSFWRDVWSWLNNEGTPLLHLTRGSQVRLEPAATDLPDLALLATLGWYLHKQQQEEASVSAIVPVIG